MAKKTCTEAELRAWTASGRTDDEIGAHLGRSPNTVMNARIVLGINKDRGRPAKISQANVEEAVAHLAQGKSLASYCTAQGIVYRSMYSRLAHSGLPTSARAAIKREKDLTDRMS